MPNFTDSLADAVRGATCGILSTNENIQGWWARNTNIPFTGTLANAATALRQSLCDNPAPVPPIPPLFQGGQCSDTFYDFRYDAINFFPDGTVANEDFDRGGQGFGPFRTTYVPLGQGAVPQIAFADSDGVFSTWGAPGGFGSYDVFNFRITVLSGPDNCGISSPDTPAVPVDLPLQPPAPIEVTYVTNEGDTVTQLGDFNLFAPVFLPGSVTFPFEVNFPDVTINGDINLDGTIEVNLEPGRQPDDTETDTEPPVLPPGQEPVDPETERRIIGVHVFTTLPAGSPVTIINQDGGPNIFAPRGGSVRFLVLGGSQASWTTDIDIKADREYIPCDARQGAISVVANPLPGGTTSIIRVYGTIPSYLIPGA